MTKTIKNITPRAIGDTFDVAYLSDLSAMNSEVEADIAYLSAIIGDFENDSSMARHGSNITKTLGIIDSDLTTITDTLGYVLNDSATKGYRVTTREAVYNNLLALDDAIGQIPTDGPHITDSNASDVGQALAVLDNALADLEGSHDALYSNVASAFGSQLHANDDTGWYMEFAGNYVGSATNVGDAIEALDAKLVNVVTDHGELVEAMGAAYNGDGSWDFTVLETYPEVLASASSATGAFVALAHAIESAQIAGEVTLSATAGTGGLLSVYTLYQGGTAVSNVVGRINIPKDFLVKSATLETVTTADVPYAGAKVGDKYIDFVINAKDAFATAEHIYLPVNDLVDVYTGGSNAEVQVAIDSSNVITATLVNSGVTTSKIADSAVTTAKVLDSAVTTIKINDSAVTTAKIADGAVNTNKIKLVDTADSSKAYTLQVTSGRLQVLEIQA